MELCGEPTSLDSIVCGYLALTDKIYWCVSGFCISAYTTGSSLLAYGEARFIVLSLTTGLTAQQSMACVVIGALITGMLSVISGMPGEIHHIGFTVISRCSWGMKGSYFVSLLSRLSPNFSLSVYESSRLFGGLGSSPTGGVKL
jgi:hypothetical protein